MRPVLIEISPGELMDRITILRLKVTHLADEHKRARLTTELEALTDIWESAAGGEGLGEIVEELAGVNGRLWEVEDELRSCEGRGEFGERFVELARSVYGLNDRRAELKRRINRSLGVEGGEEKVYAGEATKGKKRHEGKGGGAADSR